jgi:RNA polymerase sigma-70 factor (ECF subfamily)
MDKSVSLLDGLRGGPAPAAWPRLDDLYRPLIRRWALRDAALYGDADDVLQEVMAVLVRELPHFRREHLGSFRRYLRTVTHNRVLASRRKRREFADGDGPLAQLADPNSELSRLWNHEHDRHVFCRLRELLATESPFEPATVRVFRMVVLEE